MASMDDMVRCIAREASFSVDLKHYPITLLYERNLLRRVHYEPRQVASIANDTN